MRKFISKAEGNKGDIVYADKDGYIWGGDEYVASDRMYPILLRELKEGMWVELNAFKRYNKLCK